MTIRLGRSGLAASSPATPVVRTDNVIDATAKNLVAKSRMHSILLEHFE